MKRCEADGRSWFPNRGASERIGLSQVRWVVRAAGSNTPLEIQGERTRD
jgi:hypothetical protein